MTASLPDPHDDPPVALPDRSTGLLVFGILTILLGGICGLVVVFLFASQAMIQRDPALADPRALWYSGIFYLGLSVAFVWLGIGSILARRWARALLVVLCGSWTAIGLVSLAAMAVVMPGILSSTPSPNGPMTSAAVTTILAISLTFSAVIFLIIPGGWTFFYSRPSVRATCETRDPVTRWTDRCPLPVLAVVLWVAFGVPAFLAAPLAGMAVLPLFGHILTGIPATILCVLLAGVMAWLARGLYRLDGRALVALAILVILFAVASVLTYSRHGLRDIYAAMGYSSAQIALMEQYAFPQEFLTWGVLLWTVPVLAYLAFLRRFFRRDAR